jgi:hypothetical protein
LRRGAHTRTNFHTPWSRSALYLTHEQARQLLNVLQELHSYDKELAEVYEEVEKHGPLKKMTECVIGSERVSY